MTRITEQDYSDYENRKQKEFYDKYPLCFPKGAPPCGFDIGYGWWPLVDKLCADITKELENKPPCSDWETFQISQIKEKWGGLRCYIDNGGGLDSNIYQLIITAENKSFEICEECGSPGRERGGGWIKVRCDQCEAARKTLEKPFGT